MSNAEKLKRRTSLLSVASNTLLVLLKLAVGLYVGAVSLISEALHSGVDLLAALIAFWAVKKASQPPDIEHDYGHGKFENLSAAIEAILIVLAALAIVYESVTKFSESAVPETLGYGVAIMVISIIVNIIVSERLIRVAKKTNSQALEADGLHLRSDVWTSVGVFVGLFAMNITGWAWLDPVIAIFVAGIIFRAGWHMIKNSVLELTDASLSDEEEEKLLKIITAVPEVKGCHCLRTRKSGTYKMLDVHVLFDGNLPLSRVHAVCDELEDIIRARCGTFDVLIHAEPDAGHAAESKVSRYDLAKAAEAKETLAPSGEEV